MYLYIIKQTQKLNIMKATLKSSIYAKTFNGMLGESFNVIRETKKTVIVEYKERTQVLLKEMVTIN